MCIIPVYLEALFQQLILWRSSPLLWCGWDIPSCFGQVCWPVPLPPLPTLLPSPCLPLCLPSPLHLPTTTYTTTHTARSLPLPQPSRASTVTVPTCSLHSHAPAATTTPFELPISSSYQPLTRLPRQTSTHQPTGTRAFRPYSALVLLWPAYRRRNNGQQRGIWRHRAVWALCCEQLRCVEQTMNANLRRSGTEPTLLPALARRADFVAHSATNDKPAYWQGWLLSRERPVAVLSCRASETACSVRAA